jgi:hypothetical protein
MKNNERVVERRKRKVTDRTQLNLYKQRNIISTDTAQITTIVLDIYT